MLKIIYLFLPQNLKNNTLFKNYCKIKHFYNSKQFLLQNDKKISVQGVPK